MQLCWQEPTWWGYYFNGKELPIHYVHVAITETQRTDNDRNQKLAECQVCWKRCPLANLQCQWLKQTAAHNKVENWDPLRSLRSSQTSHLHTYCHSLDLSFMWLYNTVLFSFKTRRLDYFLFGGDSLLAAFTVVPRNRCCWAEDRLELKLQNAFGILTPMFPVYCIIFLCGDYVPVGGQ